jgi:hypothetical protein
VNGAAGYAISSPDDATHLLECDSDGDVVCCELPRLEPVVGGGPNRRVLALRAEGTYDTAAGVVRVWRESLAAPPCRALLVDAVVTGPSVTLYPRPLDAADACACTTTFLATDDCVLRFSDADRPCGCPGEPFLPAITAARIESSTGVVTFVLDAYQLASGAVSATTPNEELPGDAALVLAGCAGEARVPLSGNALAAATYELVVVDGGSAYAVGAPADSGQLQHCVDSDVEMTCCALPLDGGVVRSAAVAADFVYAERLDATYATELGTVRVWRESAVRLPSTDAGN